MASWESIIDHIEKKKQKTKTKSKIYYPGKPVDIQEFQEINPHWVFSHPIPLELGKISRRNIAWLYSLYKKQNSIFNGFLLDWVKENLACEYFKEIEFLQSEKESCIRFLQKQPRFTPVKEQLQEIETKLFQVEEVYFGWVVGLSKELDKLPTLIKEFDAANSHAEYEELENSNIIDQYRWWFILLEIENLFPEEKIISHLDGDNINWEKAKKAAVYSSLPQYNLNPYTEK